MKPPVVGTLHPKCPKSTRYGRCVCVCCSTLPRLFARILGNSHRKGKWQTRPTQRKGKRCEKMQPIPHVVSLSGRLYLLSFFFRRSNTFDLERAHYKCVVKWKCILVCFKSAAKVYLARLHLIAPKLLNPYTALPGIFSIDPGALDYGHPCVSLSLSLY